MTRPRIRAAALAVTAMLLATTAGCDGRSATDPASATGGVSGALTVLAAASLTESFTQLGREFEAAHPQTRVTFSFAGSSALAAQINQGAPADVFASANPATMQTVTEAGNGDDEPVTFARNQLVIAVPEGNPGQVRGLADLTRPGVTVAFCAPQVPCGAAAQAVTTAAGVRLTPVTFEQDVRAALAKVRLGEVDAALVYRTDIPAASAEVDGVEFAESAGAVNDCRIVVLRDAPHPAAAQAFVAYVLAAPGRSVLAEAGFRLP